MAFLHARCSSRNLVISPERRSPVVIHSTRYLLRHESQVRCTVLGFNREPSGGANKISMSLVDIEASEQWKTVRRAGRP